MSRYDLENVRLQRTSGTKCLRQNRQSGVAQEVSIANPAKDLLVKMSSSESCLVLVNSPNLFAHLIGTDDLASDVYRFSVLDFFTDEILDKETCLFHSPDYAFAAIPLGWTETAGRTCCGFISRTMTWSGSLRHFDSRTHLNGNNIRSSCHGGLTSYYLDRHSLPDGCFQMAKKPCTLDFLIRITSKINMPSSYWIASEDSLESILNGRLWPATAGRGSQLMTQSPAVGYLFLNRDNVGANKVTKKRSYLMIQRADWLVLWSEERV